MQESANLAGESQASEAGGESRKPAKSAIEQIGELLRGDDPGQGDQGDQGSGESRNQGDQGDQGGESDDGKPGESQAKGKPKTVNELAERLGVTVKDLYEIKFPLGNQAGGDGESRTLGELKDMASQHGQFEVDRMQFEESKTKRENEFMRAQAEMSELLSMLPKNAIKPELLQAVANKRTALLKREKARTLEVIPEWSDEETETAERGEMQEHLSAYGYSRSYLDSVTDHRTLKYIRDNMQRQKRIERALAQVKQVSKPGHRPSNKPTPPGRGSNLRSDNPRQVRNQVAAISDLLKNSG